MAMKDDLRTKIAHAVMESMVEDHETTDYVPDMCYRTADRVLAATLSYMTGQVFDCKWEPPNVIGPAQLVSDGVKYF